MTCNWTKKARDAAKRDRLPLIYLAVDGWHCEKRFGKLELSGPADVQMGRFLDAFIHGLVKGMSVEQAYEKARAELT